MFIHEFELLLSLMSTITSACTACTVTVVMLSVFLSGLQNFEYKLIFYPLKDVYIHRDIEAASLENSLTSGPHLELIYRCYKYMCTVNKLVPVHDIQSMSYQQLIE